MELQFSNVLANRFGFTHVVLMLKAYFDESGHAKDPNESVLSIGGCFSPADSWERFEEEWKEVLSTFHVTQFHARCFAHSRKDFTGWDEKRRRQFLGALIDIMNRHIVQYVGAVLPLSEYESLTEEQKRQCPDPYFMCFEDSIHCTAIEASEYGPSEKVEYIFSSHPEFSGLSRDCYRACEEQLPLPLRERLWSFDLREPTDVVQLQAADMVAYELNKLGHLMQNPKKTPFNKLRWPMQQILRKDPGFRYYMDGELARRIEE